MLDAVSVHSTNVSSKCSEQDAESPRKLRTYSSEASTISGEFDSTSEKSSVRSWCSTDSVKVIDWDKVKFGHQIQPHEAWAHCSNDINLLSRFIELTTLPDIKTDSVRLLLHTLKFLHMCHYSVEDICSILAHASSYFRDFYALCGTSMDTSEAVAVLVTHLYIAHAFVVDESCPLKIWHKHLLSQYCDVKALNAAVMRLMEVRRYKLRLADKDRDERYSCLLESQKRSVPWTS